MEILVDILITIMNCSNTISHLIFSSNSYWPHAIQLMFLLTEWINTPYANSRLDSKIIHF
jgi:hypothetical protein